MQDDLIAVTQADREAAFALFKYERCLSDSDHRAAAWRSDLDRGLRDDQRIVQAFAKHRQQVENATLEQCAIICDHTANAERAHPYSRACASRLSKLMRSLSSWSGQSQ